MDDTIKTKGILKKSHSTPPTQVTSLSWLSRIQSKLSLNTQQDTSFRLKRQDLERVTFSIGQLTTEHLLYDDTQQEQQLPSTTLPLASATITDYMPFLPHCYEKSCRLREEKEWPLLMDLLQSHCNTPLTNIDLNGRTIYPATMGPFSDILLLDFGLRTLRLSNCGLNDESIGTLLNSLLKTDTVVELDISHNPLKNKSYKLLSIYIVESKSITSLDISKTSPDQRALHYLSRALLSTTSLQHLNMNQCSLKATQLEAIAPGICRSPSLTSLSLCHNRFSSNSIHILATLISKEHQPTEVDYDNQIYEHDKNDQYPNTTDSGLEKLDLTGNPLQDMAIGGLCQALGKNRTLKHLSLANCQIYSNGCELVADALYSNQCLETLDLSINPLMRGSDKGIHALKSALLRNDTLRQLVLTNTDLDATAAIMIAEVLPMNTALTRLDLSQNPSISLAGILALSVSVKMNRTITFLDISIPVSKTINQKKKKVGGGGQNEAKRGMTNPELFVIC
ncbi:hypothetical protein BC941DRAFT_421740 [Chlamydoabsidia padenii]|nr:hypothetical protein BC941DRAFT_421740 [Chlamydoabsidia padenii]